MKTKHWQRRHFLKSATAAVLGRSVSAAALTGLPLGGTALRAQNSDAALRAHNLAYAVQPRLQLKCETPADVQAAVRRLTAAGTPFSTYSSGHCFAGYSLHPDAVIDVSGLDRIIVTADQVTAGPGAQVGPLIRRLGEAGRTLPAGFCQTVALGGHLGCGGIGHLSRSHGLLADYLLSAKMVTAEGDIVTASESENSDLYWALRGGGPGSFGVVAEMRFRTVPDMAATHIRAFARLPVAQAAKVAAAWQRWAMRLPDTVASTIEAMSPDFEDIQLGLSVIASEDSPALRNDIVRFMSSVPWRDAPDVTQGRFSALADVFWPRDYYPIDMAAYGSAFAEQVTDQPVWTALLETLTRQQAPRLSLLAERLGGAMARVAPEATGFAHRDAAFLWQFEGRLNRLHSQEEQGAAVQRLTQRLAQTTRGVAYAGYPDPRLENWQQAYWAGNYPRLQAVKRAYDPGNVFRHRQSVRPS